MFEAHAINTIERIRDTMNVELKIHVPHGIKTSSDRHHSLC